MRTNRNANMLTSKLSLDQRHTKGRDAYASWKSGLQTQPNFNAMGAEADREIELAIRLAQARVSSGLTQVELAKRMGVSQAQISRLEKGGYESYNIQTIKRYLAALGSGYKMVVDIVPPTLA